MQYYLYMPTQAGQKSNNSAENIQCKFLTRVQSIILSCQGIMSVLHAYTCTRMQTNNIQADEQNLTATTRVSIDKIVVKVKLM